MTQSEDEKTLRNYILRPEGTLDWGDARDAFNRILSHHAECVDALRDMIAISEHHKNFGEFYLNAKSVLEKDGK